MKQFNGKRFFRAVRVPLPRQRAGAHRLVVRRTGRWAKHKARERAEWQEAA